MSDLKERFIKIKSLMDTEEARNKALKNEIAFLESDLDVKQQESSLLDLLAEKEVENGVNSYVLLLEEGLKTIFPEKEIGQVAEITKLRGKIAVKLKTTVKGEDGILVEGEGLDTFGGAVTTVQSLLLRVCLILKRDLRPFLLLDETFPAIDDARTTLFVQFLKVLCQRLDMDILCITHKQAIAEQADLAYKITATKNGSKFDLI